MVFVGIWVFFTLYRFFKQGFTQRITMENHISGVHEKKKPFACAYCDYHCAYQGNLNTHIQTVHEKRRPHKCEKCEYSCTQKSVLKRHVQSVHEKAAGGVQAAAAAAVPQQQTPVAAAAASTATTTVVTLPAAAQIVTGAAANQVVAAAAQPPVGMPMALTVTTPGGQQLQTIQQQHIQQHQYTNAITLQPQQQHQQGMNGF